MKKPHGNIGKTFTVAQLRARREGYERFVGLDHAEKVKASAPAALYWLSKIDNLFMQFKIAEIRQKHPNEIRSQLRLLGDSVWKKDKH